MDASSRLKALLVVAARLARAESRAEAIRIATIEGVGALSGHSGVFAEATQPGAARKSEPGGMRALTVPVRTKDSTCGSLSAELPGDANEARALLALLADLLAAALEREARVAALVLGLGRAGETQRFLAQASEALALSLDDHATLRVLARLAVPRLADWCLVDFVTPEGAVERSTVTHADGEDPRLVDELVVAVPGRGAIGPDALEFLASDLAAGGGLPVDLVPAALAIGARSAIVVYAPDASGGGARIALFAARSGRRLGFDDFALAEELARRTSQALERASLYGEAQRANEAKDVFLATVSHELRGPLAAVSMWTHVLGLKTCDEPTRGRAVEAIDESVRALGRLIEDMIDLSRLVGGNLSLDVAPLSMAALVRDAIDAASPAAQAKGVAFVARADVDASVSADAQRLLQALGNVVANAIAFTPPNGTVEVALVALADRSCRSSCATTERGLARSSSPTCSSRSGRRTPR